jgi:hypothetical protein
LLGCRRALYTSPKLPRPIFSTSSTSSLFSSHFSLGDDGKCVQQKYWTYVKDCGSRSLLPVLRIRIRIHMFLDLLDLNPDPSVRGMDLDPSIIKKNLDSYCFVTSF